MARNLEEIIKCEDPRIVSAAKHKAEKILQSINNITDTATIRKRKSSPLVKKSKKGQ